VILRAAAPVALVLAGGLALAGQAAAPVVATAVLPTQTAVAPAPASAASAPEAARPPAPAVAPRTPVPAAGITPARVLVPRIGVDAPVIELGLDDTGALEVPETRDETGWFTGGARPGAPGAAVIAGHVSLRRGPAVFARLNQLAPGDLVDVADRAGRRIRFVVNRVERHPKNEFPTAAVYGPTTGAELRLVTCGGSLDLATGSFRDNVVVFARRI
jgi:sortase (surface protein transpeptidase)